MTAKKNDFDDDDILDVPVAPQLVLMTAHIKRVLYTTVNEINGHIEKLIRAQVALWFSRCFGIEVEAVVMKDGSGDVRRLNLTGEKGDEVIGDED
ncbi:hypothetical protein AC249_AIPGENE18077 [Exaiptasia diaphana]|nr:hypothetical protein AC249_AIPGENE18077 [Exaiptasia diaphana]